MRSAGAGGKRTGEICNWEVQIAKLRAAENLSQTTGGEGGDERAKRFRRWERARNLTIGTLMPGGACVGTAGSN